MPLPQLINNNIIWSIDDSELRDVGTIGNRSMGTEEFVNFTRRESLEWRRRREFPENNIITLRFPSYNYDEYEDLDYSIDTLPNMFTLIAAINTYYNKIPNDLVPEKEIIVKAFHNLGEDEQIYMYHLLMVEGDWFQGLLMIEPGIYQVMIGT